MVNEKWWLPTRVTGCDCSIDHNLSTLSQSSSLVVIQVTTFPHPKEGNTELAPNGAHKEGWEIRLNGRDLCEELRILERCNKVCRYNEKSIQKPKQNASSNLAKQASYLWLEKGLTSDWDQAEEERKCHRGYQNISGTCHICFETRSLFRFVRVKGDAQTPPDFWLPLPLGAAGYIGTPTGGWLSVG